MWFMTNEKLALSREVQELSDRWVVGCFMQGLLLRVSCIFYMW
jgi:hypothetical protein